MIGWNGNTTTSFMFARHAQKLGIFLRLLCSRPLRFDLITFIYIGLNVKFDSGTTTSIDAAHRLRRATRQFYIGKALSSSPAEVLRTLNRHKGQSNLGSLSKDISKRLFFTLTHLQENFNTIQAQGVYEWNHKLENITIRPSPGIYPKAWSCCRFLCRVDKSSKNLGKNEATFWSYNVLVRNGNYHR